jgi:toxin ParE1/3/4
MPNLRKRPRAERDLREIWRYTAATWGDHQADRYLRDLERAMRQAARDPDRAPFAPELGPGLHRLTFERHRIFFRVESDDLVVIRVLHDQMDFARHLQDQDKA